MNKLTLVILMATLAFGCAGSTIKMTDSNGNPVSIKHRLGGRGCIAITTESGEVGAVLQQDGSSDWSGIRVIPSLARAALAVFFGSSGDDNNSYAGPSDIQGCAGLFETYRAEDDENVLYELLPAD
jgi:hypothetical protein